MKQTTHFLLALFFVSLGSNVFADSLVINYSNNKRLYKWDGTHLIDYRNNRRLYRWDGTKIINYSNNKRFFRWNGEHIINYSNNKRLIRIDGLIPIPLIVLIAVGLL